MQIFFKVAWTNTVVKALTNFCMKTILNKYWSGFQSALNTRF